MRPNRLFDADAQARPRCQRSWFPQRAGHLYVRPHMNLVRSLAALVAIGLGQSLAQAQAHAPVPDSLGSLEYSSVPEALEALKSKPGVSITVTKPDGWILATEGQSIVWSFTPIGHYAHPAVVRRELLVRNGEAVVETRALCQAEKLACDKLIGEFQELNEHMRQSVQERIGVKR